MEEYAGEGTGAQRHGANGLAGAAIQLQFEAMNGDLVEGAALSVSNGIQVITNTPNPGQKKVYRRNGVLIGIDSGIADQ